MKNFVEFILRFPVLSAALFWLVMLLAATTGCGPASSSGSPHPYLVHIEGQADTKTVRELHEAVNSCHFIVSAEDPQPWIPADLVIHETLNDLRKAVDTAIRNDSYAVVEFKFQNVFSSRRPRPRVHVWRGYKNVPVGLAHGMYHVQRGHVRAPGVHDGFSPIDARWKASTLAYWLERTL